MGGETWLDEAFTGGMAGKTISGLSPWCLALFPGCHGPLLWCSAALSCGLNCYKSWAKINLFLESWCWVLCLHEKKFTKTSGISSTLVSLGSVTMKMLVFEGVLFPWFFSIFLSVCGNTCASVGDGSSYHLNMDLLSEQVSLDDEPWGLVCCIVLSWVVSMSHGVFFPQFLCLSQCVTFRLCPFHSSVSQSHIFAVWLGGFVLMSGDHHCYHFPFERFWEVN